MSDVYTALADPTRRLILERLFRDGPCSVTQLAAPLSMTRQAVSKHLDVLQDAGLLESELRGRERVNRARPSPLSEVSRWVDGCSAEWDARLDRLQHYVDGDQEG